MKVVRDPAFGIDFGTKLRADREAYLLGKYFKAIELKITAHEIPSTKDDATFKELVGVTRRNASPLLEPLDAERTTRRGGSVREILGT